MGALWIDGASQLDRDHIPTDDDRATAAAYADRDRLAAANWTREIERLRGPARRCTGMAVKARARAYQRQVARLDGIAGLNAASSPAEIIAIAAMHLQHAPAPRWGGMGGEAPRINLKGAILYARWLRRVYRAAGLAVAGRAA